MGERQTAVKLKSSTIILKQMRTFVLITLSGNDGTGDSAHTFAQNRQSLRCSHTQSMDVADDSCQNYDL